ncbi:MAG: MmcB family DNA repair protein [Chloroflexi bacterium]|nr:MmcB family DNA repair protein [Chloroflexota bacterium]
MLDIPKIELLVVHHFDPRANVIVPNVYWGLELSYEADLVVLRPSGFAVEVEIKTSRADLRADRKKRHTHNSRLFRELWFALPLELADDSSIPEKAGILAIATRKTGLGDYHSLNTIRRGTLNRNAIRWTEAQRRKLLELGVMRIWSLKQVLQNNRTRTRGKP